MQYICFKFEKGFIHLIYLPLSSNLRYVFVFKPLSYISPTSIIERGEMRVNSLG